MNDEQIDLQRKEAWNRLEALLPPENTDSEEEKIKRHAEVLAILGQWRSLALNWKRDGRVPVIACLLLEGASHQTILQANELGLCSIRR